MKALKLLGRAVVALLFLFLLVSVGVPAIARAQFVANGGGSAVDVVAALVDKDVSVKTLQLTGSSGTVLSLTTDGTKICLGSNANWCIYVDVPNQVVYIPGGLRAGAGQNIVHDVWYPVQDIPPLIAGTKGFRSLNASTVTTCGAATAPEGTILPMASSATSRTRLCYCLREGDSGAYRWLNLGTGDTGTTTTDCPETAI